MRLSAFLGVWCLDRRIEDARASRSGRLIGEARLSPVPDGLAYEEAGTLTFRDTPPMQATRRYLWREAGAGGIDVLFDDGRFFHRFDPAAPAPAASHDCAPDTYRVRYDFGDWPVWQAEWRVAGPEKDYTMLSRYSPGGRE